MDNVYFLYQIKHNATTDTWDKGIVVKSDPEKDNEEEVLQAYHAFLGAYAYNHDPNIDYVRCEVVHLHDTREPLKEIWVKKT